MRLGLARILACAFGLGQLASPSLAADFVVDQVTDIGASAASGMFRFSPELLRIAPGDTVTFLNSRGSHTVRTQQGLWPEDAAPIDIRGQSRTTVTFESPGLYGIACGRHGRYGMAMIVAVGAVDAGSVAPIIDELDAPDRARETFRDLLARLSDLQRP